MPKAAEMLAHEYIYTRNLELSQISMNYSAPIPERLFRWCDHQLPVRNIPRASAAPATKPTPIAEPWTAETCALVPNTAAPCRSTSSQSFAPTAAAVTLEWPATSTHPQRLRRSHQAQESLAAASAHHRRSMRIWGRPHLPLDRPLPDHPRPP